LNAWLKLIIIIDLIISACHYKNCYSQLTLIVDKNSAIWDYWN